MKPRILIAAGLAVTAAGAAYFSLDSAERQIRGGRVIKVIVAREALKAGARLQETAVAVRAIPEQFHHPEAILEAEAPDFIGRPVQNALRAGQPVLKTDFDHRTVAQDKSLSEILPKGMRAFSIPVDASAAIAGLLQPGDHVDVLGTFARDGRSDRATVTLLQNVTVLATGGRMDTTAAATPARNASFPHVTLAVNLEEAELLAFSVKRGELTLALRQTEDLQTSENVPEKTFADIFEPQRRVALQQKHRTIEALRANRTR